MTHESYEVPASLDGPGIRFHGVRRHRVPEHVWQAIRDAGQRVLDNYTRVGTPCGHTPSPVGANHCKVMICPYVLPRDEQTRSIVRSKDDQRATTYHQDVPSLPGAHKDRVLPGQAGPRGQVNGEGSPRQLSPGQRHLMRIWPELNIACMLCGAQRGFKCTSPNGRAYSPAHQSRRQTWHSTPEHQKNELIGREN